MATQYYDLSKTDSMKIHRLFSPFVVPSDLTADQVNFCVDLHDRTYPNGTVLDGKIEEIWLATKKRLPAIDAHLHKWLTRSYRAKEYVKGDIDGVSNYMKNMTAIENYANTLQEPQREKFYLAYNRFQSRGSPRAVNRRALSAFVPPKPLSEKERREFIVKLKAICNVF